MALEYSVSKHTIYAWKAKFGGMDASEAQKLRALEDENNRLKRLFRLFFKHDDVAAGVVIAPIASIARRLLRSIRQQCN